MEKAVHMDDHLTLGEKIDKGTLAGVKFQLDGNADIQSKGADIATATQEASDADAHVESLKSQLAAAEVIKSAKAATLDNVYNGGVDKANEVYPGKVDILKGLSLTMAKDHKARPLCEKGTGGSMVQSGHSGKGNFHCNKLANAKDFRLMETTDPATLDETKYYAANPVSFDNSRGGEVTPKTVGVITWWRFYGHNAAGDGIWSDPFGGFPIH
jgi:hypothetical protein